MEFLHSYYDEDIICNFYVPSMMKRTWAAGVQILADIDEVCRKNNIQYFAAWGTLLGTIRHGGYIPWDDDLDICMKRKDYEKFLSIAKQEMPDGYDIVSYKTSKIYKQLLCRVVNTDHYRFDKEFMEKFSGLPFAMGIDIFPMDYLSDDEEYEKNRYEKVYYVQNIIDAIEKTNTPVYKLAKELNIIECNCGVKIKREGDVPFQLRQTLEQLYSEVPEEKATYLTMYEVWFNRHGYKNPKEYFDYSIRLPFENITIPVPLHYNSVLEKNYSKSFMKPVRKGSSHNYPSYQNHIDVLKEHFDFEWPTYYFRTNDLDSSNVSRNKSFGLIVDEYISDFLEMGNKMQQGLSENNYEYVCNIAIGCQERAIKLGGLIEQRYCVGTKTVSWLEQYCENLYELCTMISGENEYTYENVAGTIDNLSVILKEFGDEFSTELASKKMILFISVSPKYLSSMQKLVDYYQNKSDCVVKIVPITHVEISPDMSKSEVIFESDGYPEGLDYLDYSELDLSIHPDVIVYNYPYDQYNILTTTEKQYYSNNLLINTDKLIYHPYCYVGQMEKSDPKSVINLKNCLQTPLAAICDEIVLFDEPTTSLYIEELVSLTDEKYKPLWEQKIKYLDISGEQVKEYMPKAKERTKLLYYFGIDSVVSLGKKMLDKLEQVVSVFEDNEIDVIFMEQKGMRDALRECDYQLYLDYCKTAKIIENTKNIEVVHEEKAASYYALLCDAYYGEQSKYMSEFLLAKKPVMQHAINC